MASMRRERVHRDDGAGDSLCEAEDGMVSPTGVSCQSCLRIMAEPRILREASVRPPGSESVTDALRDALVALRDGWRPSETRDLQARITRILPDMEERRCHNCGELTSKSVCPYCDVSRCLRPTQPQTDA